MQADLSARVGSRICHDLISPIGAISNGVELLMLTQAADGEEITLIKQSVDSAAARIKFFRIAYGLASPEQSTSATEVIGILDALSAAGRISHQWDIVADQPRDLLQCIFLMWQALETALPLGGTIGVATTDDGSIRMTATGNRVTFDQDHWNTLQSPQTKVTVTAALVQFALLPDLLARLSRAVTVTATNNQLEVVF